MASSLGRSSRPRRAIWHRLGRDTAWSRFGRRDTKPRAIPARPSDPPGCEGGGMRAVRRVLLTGPNTIPNLFSLKSESHESGSACLATQSAADARTLSGAATEAATSRSKPISDAPLTCDTLPLRRRPTIVTPNSDGLRRTDRINSGSYPGSDSTPWTTDHRTPAPSSSGNRSRTASRSGTCRLAASVAHNSPNRS